MKLLRLPSLDRPVSPALAKEFRVGGVAVENEARGRRLGTRGVALPSSIPGGGGAGGGTATNAEISQGVAYWEPRPARPLLSGRVPAGKSTTECGPGQREEHTVKRQLYQ